MALTLTDGNFGYSGDAVTNPAPVGDPSLAGLMGNFKNFSGAFGEAVPSFNLWFNNITKGLTPQQQAEAWNDVVGDYSSTYRNVAGTDFIPNNDSVNSFLNALKSITPAKDFLGGNIIGDTSGKTLKPATNITRDLGYDPATKEFLRQAMVGTPNQATDRISNLFDYIMTGNQSASDPTVSIQNAAANTGNRSALQNLYAGIGSNRLTGDLSKAFKNITGIDALPADFLSGIGSNSFNYYTNPGQYDTDYQTQLGNLFNTQSVKNVLDPAYTAAQTKMGFANNDTNKQNFYKSAAQYGLSNINDDLSMWTPPPSTQPTTPTTPDTPTLPTPGTGTSVTVPGSTPNYRDARTDMQRGSRYFSTDTGNYQGLGSLFNNQQGSF